VRQFGLGLGVLWSAGACGVFGVSVLAGEWSVAWWAVTYGWIGLWLVWTCRVRVTD